MSGLISSDPLATLAMEAGMVRAPLAEGAAQGDTQLDSKQRAAAIGEPVPIVFCRRDETAGTGGVLISPAATEARFSNDASNAVTASYHLVLSEGRIGSIQVRDVFQRSCRVGSFSQTYDRRAGTWTPGNFIVDRSTPPRLFYITYIPDMMRRYSNTEHAKRAEQYDLINTTVVTDPEQLNHWPFKAEGRQYMWDYNFKEATLTNSSNPDALSSWYIPGNIFYAPTKYIPAKSYNLPAASYYCGTVGTYTGMSTLSFEVTIPDGFDQWDRQVHCFIRNGMEVTRLLDNVTGSSNNFADLYNWSLSNCAKLSADQIDYSSLASTARFLHVNGFNCDINITKSQNLGDMVADMAPYFLLTETRVAGRRGLRPVLPVNSDGTIKTTPVEWAYTFTEDHILPDQLQISYVPPADRKPFAVRAIWRQQLDDDHGIIRSSEVRLAGEAEEGPYEQHDLSQFCTRENHAVKIAAYIRARRKYTTHTASVSCRTIDFPQTLQAGDIVRLKLYRSSDIAASGLWDYLYQIERITKTAAGDVSMDLVHFPINSSGVSPIALAVAETFGDGIMLTSNRTGVSCDASPSRASDTSVPAETYQSGTYVAPVSYIYGGGIWEEWSQVPPDIDEETPPNVILNEPKDPPPEEPPEEKPEPAPETEPETPQPISGFQGAFAPGNWDTYRWFEYNLAWQTIIPDPGAAGGYAQFGYANGIASTVTLYAPVYVYNGVLGYGGNYRFYLFIVPPYSCVISFDWAFYPQSAPAYDNDIPLIYRSGYTEELPNGFNINNLNAQSGSQTISIDATNEFGFVVDVVDLDYYRGTLVISNFVVTPL